MLGLKHFGAVSRNTDFEFHGYETHKGKGRYFKAMKLHLRIQIMDDLFDIVKKQGIEIIYALVNKTKNKALLHPHQLAFLFLGGERGNSSLCRHAGDTEIPRRCAPSNDKARSL